MTAWKQMCQSVDEATDKVQIAIVGEYIGLADSYLSVYKALQHASIACKRHLDLVWIEATHLEPIQENTPDQIPEHEYQEAWEKLRSCHAVVVPGGFGIRGFLGKTLASEYCRTSQTPLLGICLGFQAMVVDYCRNILHWNDANSAEFHENAGKNVIIFMPEIDKDRMGGTMRLGSRLTRLQDGGHSLARTLYGGKQEISERHRHRYEVNPRYVSDIESAGLRFVGRDETGTRMEIAELHRDRHPFYFGCQFHPEFQSRPLKPSPPFLGLVSAACGTLNEVVKQN